MEIIERPEILSQVLAHIGKGLIIVLVGQRRVGKSYVLKMLRNKIASTPENANIIYIDKEKREFDSLKTYTDLNSYIEAHFAPKRHNYILIDEAQDIQEFERSVRSYRTEPNTDVVITGSNSHTLSSELSTLLGGRYREIYVQPLSYREFLTFHGLADTDDSLALYLDYGGLPGLARIGLNEDDAREYQWDVYHTALLKDVIMRHNIRNSVFLENLVRFLADNEGKLISASSISKYMRGQGANITPTAILNYISYLAEAFIIDKADRYDIHGKRLLESNSKYYFEDNGIRNAIAGGSREGDIEKVLENVVYQHLVRLGYRVYVGQLQAGEIDFVCEKSGGKRAYVQVSYIIIDDSTRKREFGPLASIADNYPKYVISMTPLVSRSDYNGITHLHLRRFLMQGLG